MAAFFERAAACLALSSPEEKCAAAADLWLALQSGNCEFDPATPVIAIGAVGRPARPVLVEPSQVKRRRLGTAEGRAALAHAIAHIEFNAINLALDAACRFRGLPAQFYHDWVSVAADEARHFQMLSSRLRSMGFAYGDFPAHNGLWEMAQRTASDCMKRMALVPRVLEARGLDVTPGMIRRLQQAGDPETATVLEIILQEEIRHVEIGSHWFRRCCEQRGLDPETTFLALLGEHFEGALKGPFNLCARRQAG
ncbi:MAG TPA: ferritin-like domain-containing protein, partial [Afifellaceae bacterium]|nr:ferritin-like domain-containing protein [Afifellaceae bacterium]